MQHCAPFLCNTDPCACASPTLMSVQCRSRCHDLHTPTPPFFLHLLYQQNCVQSDARCGFGSRFVLKVSSQIANNMRNMHRAGRNQILQNSAAKYRIPSALQNRKWDFKTVLRCPWTYKGKHERKSGTYGQNHSQNTEDRHFSALFLFSFLPCMWGVGGSKSFPIIFAK